MLWATQLSLVKYRISSGSCSLSAVKWAGSTDSASRERDAILEATSRDKERGSSSDVSRITEHMPRNPYRYTRNKNYLGCVALNMELIRLFDPQIYIYI